MRYGMPSLIEFRTVEEHARFCAEHELDFFELNLALPWFQSDKIDPDDLLRIKERYGIDYTVHFHDEINPFDFCPEMREGCLKSVSYVLDLARHIGAKRVNMHLLNGTYSAVNGQKVYAYGLCEEEYLGFVRTFIDMVEKKMSGMDDCIFCIENTSGFRFYHKHAIELMLKSPVFGLTFDIGHNYKASEDDESFILEHSDRLRHFHIHDVTAKSNHVALGTGVLDVDRYLEMARKFDCPVVIEVKEQNALIESLDYVKAHFTRF
ncbi:MAG: sugar phosphate isomerase/epimerase [Spirochaetales bacterium]|nr:sugar phosphate isomerase/epimerase [Spirochaetales bacterium]MBQ9810038.1 sugar phosphate isomerase/epimerase [Spirochaetales bacterium]